MIMPLERAFRISNVVTCGAEVLYSVRIPLALLFMCHHLGFVPVIEFPPTIVSAENRSPGVVVITGGIHI